MISEARRCPEPGCGLEFVPVVYKDTGLVRISHMACPRNADAHALCAKLDAAEAQVKALTAELEEADKGLLFWRGIPAYTLDMTYDEAMSSKAVEAALARQKARAALKGESHE